MTVLAPAIRLTSAPFNDRHQRAFPVERSRTISPLVADGNNTVTTTKTVYLNGFLTNIVTAAPDIPTDANFTVSLLDENGTVQFLSGSIADNGNVDTNVVSSNIYLVGQFTVKIDFTTVLSGDTAEFDVWFKMTSR